MVIAGPHYGVLGRSEHPEWADNLGIALLPGKTYVGGSSFVIWKYSLREREAYELIRFLATQPTRIPGSPPGHMLPTRREALNMPSVETDYCCRKQRRNIVSKGEALLEPLSPQP